MKVARVGTAGVLAAFAVVAPVRGQVADSLWPDVTRETRPWTRWWWMGSAVDSAGITVELEALAAAGFGGVEVTSIYGVHGYEDAFVPYLSDRWVGMLLHAATEAERLGMAIDMPPGSGWRTGGPGVPAEHANASLHVAADTLREGEVWEPDLSDRRVDAVLAISAAGERIDLTEQVRGQSRARWQVPAGEWTVYTADTRFSGDSVKRPAPGGEGYSIDVFSRAATRDFLSDYGERIERVPGGALRAYFHDSFEYGGNGSRELFATFRRARGYDLKDHLPALLGEGDVDTVARVKADYRRTLNEMLLDNFLRPLTEWSHARGGLSRNQAHGSPGNLLDLYAVADIPETESFGRLTDGDADPLVNKFASSAAHVAGRPLTSAESMTWLNEHFTVTLDEAKAAADRLFLTGVNHLIYHGTAYSPPDAEWPGFLFYASTQFNSRNAIWRDLPAFNRYVARVQSVLQSGRPDNDVLLYWPIHDSWHDPEGMRIDFRVHQPDWLHEQPIGEIATTLWDSGYGFDYVSDRLLAEHVTASEGGLAAGEGERSRSPEGDRSQREGVRETRYRVVVIPRARLMPDETLDKLLELAEAGATIVFVGNLPADVPGLGDLERRRRALTTAKASVRFGPASARGVREARHGRGRVLMGEQLGPLLRAAGVRRESMVDHGVQPIRRRNDLGYSYFLRNTGSETIDGWVPLAVAAETVVIMDAVHGRIGVARARMTEEGRAEVYLQLEPGESLLLRTFERGDGGELDDAVEPWRYRTLPDAVSRRGAGRRIAGDVDPAIPLRGEWSVEFIDGGPALPAAYQTDSLVSWTERNDADAERFAGTAHYTIRFDAPPAGAGANDYLLDLGRVAESARVRLNGRDLGTLFARPFHIETGPLRASGNVLEIEVTNLSANRIRDLDRRGVRWRIFHDINFVNIDYEPFDASDWPVRASGLLGPVTLTPLASP